MAPWEHYGRTDPVLYASDVFFLGKVIWEMLAGQERLTLWYFYKDQFNVQKLSPENPDMALATRLFESCIVEDAEKCLSDAGSLLREIDATIGILKGSASIVDDKIQRKCGVCSNGDYKIRINLNTIALVNFGLSVRGEQKFKVFTCTNCGHVQLFGFPHGATPDAWMR